MDDSSNDSKRFEFTVDIDNIETSGLEVIKHVRPTWKHQDIVIKPFTAGITNKIVGYNLDGNPSEEMILIRVYGQATELFIDRQREIDNMIFLNNARCAPPLYSIFNNGLCYGFVVGRPLDWPDMRNPSIYSITAKHIARMHAITCKNQTDGQPQPLLFKTMDRFLTLVPESFDDPVKDQKFRMYCPSKHTLIEESNMLRCRLIKHNASIVFCHNDLLCQNLIYNQENESITFIDYEYGGYNYSPYDIGNHFCEFAGVDEVNYDRYPQKDLQLDWLAIYLEERRRLSGEKGIVANKQIQQLYVEVNQFALASHYFWGIWSLIQAKHSQIDFDFLSYGIMRFQEYYARKEEFLNLTI